MTRSLVRPSQDFEVYELTVASDRWRRTTPRGRESARTPGSLIALGEGIGIDQIRLVDDLVLAIELRLPDAELAPEMVIFMDFDVAFGGGRQLDTRRRRDYLVDL